MSVVPHGGRSSGHRASHDAVARAFGTNEIEPGLLEQVPRPVVKDRLLLAAGVVRIAFYDATTRRRHQVERPLEGDRRQLTPPVSLVHEDAGDPIGGQDIELSSYCLR